MSPDAAPPPAARALLEAHQVTVNYGSKTVVDQASVSCPPGTILGILGPNGAGKTSFLKALGGLLPHQGEVRFDGRRVSDLSPTERARTISYVPQRSPLNSGLSVREVVQQGRYCHREGWAGTESAADRKAVDWALDRVDARSLASRPIHKLSGGERRRILLARALCTESSVLLLDEPTASLDIAHSVALFQTLRGLSQDGRTIICVLHDLADAAQHCDQVLLLRAGETQALGRPSEVIVSALIREVYGVELVQGGGYSFRLPGGGP